MDEDKFEVWVVKEMFEDQLDSRDMFAMDDLWALGELYYDFIDCLMFHVFDFGYS